MYVAYHPVVIIGQRPLQSNGAYLELEIDSSCFMVTYMSSKSRNQMSDGVSDL